MIYLSRMMLRPKELEKIRKKISVENDELDCLTGGLENIVRQILCWKKLEKDATGSYPFASFSIEEQ